MDKVVLAFSGGLDTSVCVKLLEEKYNYEVVTACVDVGQPEEEITRSSSVAGDISEGKHYVIDAKDEFAEDYLSKCIKANALYEGYPLSTAFARPLIGFKLVEIAEKEGASAIAHGCTGKGNDQFRFESIIRSMSDFEIIAPIREMNLTRSEEQDYARKHGIALPMEKLYSIDENLWGRAIEGDELEDPMVEPPEGAFAWTASGADAPEEAQILEIEFKDGVPVAIDGEKLSLRELILKVNDIAGKHGIGRVDIIEDRMVGLKSREIYEVPGAMTIIEAHKALEGLVLTRDERKFAEYMSGLYAELVYEAKWHEPLREDLDKAIDNMQTRVTGIVNIRLHKGGLRVVGRESPFSIHDQARVSFEDKETDQNEITGMIKNHAIQAEIYQNLMRK